MQTPLTKGEQIFSTKKAALCEWTWISRTRIHALWEHYAEHTELFRLRIFQWWVAILRDLILEGGLIDSVKFQDLQGLYGWAFALNDLVTIFFLYNLQFCVAYMTASASTMEPQLKWIDFVELPRCISPLESHSRKLWSNFRNILDFSRNCIIQIYIK